MESIFNKIKSFEVDKNETKLFGIKPAIIWGNHSKKNEQFPLLYFRKPKNITDEEYSELLNSIEINFKR